MGRSLPIVTRAAVIACACAMLFVCVLSANAQTQNDDRYGFTPVPGVAGAQQPPGAMPTVQVQQQPLNPVYPQGQQPNLTPPPPAFAQNFTPPQAMVPPPGYAPPPAYPQPPQNPPQNQGFAQVPQSPYGYATPLGAPPAPAGYGYTTAANSRYGTQMAADPAAYYATSSNGQGGAYGYTLGPGDKIRVSVFGEEDLSGEYQIDSSGMVRLPLIGTIRAAGFTSPSLENAIAGALAQGYLKSPKVNVEVSAYRPFYIIGSINRPGEYPYVANMSALNAIAFGGGFTDAARTSTVYVRHEGSTREVEMPASQMTMIYPGDVVRVKNTLFWDAMSVVSPLAAPAVVAATVFK
jgi:protein involved in polysaccharide export with SLBB domain